MNALLIIDLQVGAPDDPPRLDLDVVIQRINRLAQAIRESEGLVIFIQHDGPRGHRFYYGGHQCRDARHNRLAVPTAHVPALANRL